MTPFPNGATALIASLGPAIAISTDPLSALGVAPNTGAGSICEKMVKKDNSCSRTSNKGCIPIFKFVADVFGCARVNCSRVHKYLILNILDFQNLIDN